MSRKPDRTRYLYLAPSFLLLAVFLIFPLYYLFDLSFNSYYVGLAREFVGAENYLELFSDPVFHVVMQNTVVFTVGTLVLVTLMGLATALMLNQTLRGVRILTAVFAIPWFLGIVESASAWRFLFNANSGLVNAMLLDIGVIHSVIEWLSTPSSAMSVLIVANTWKLWPFTMLTVLAGLKTIPVELYEAAKIDGADSLQRLRSITMPHLKYLLLVCSILTISWCLGSFTIVYVMTGGGPINSTLIFDVYAYNLVFEHLKLGVGSAAAALHVIIMFLLTVFYMYLLRRTGK